MLGFSDVLGHEQIKEHFHNAVQTGKVSRAYILSGEVGMRGKFLANVFVPSLLYEGGTAEPCMQCHTCRQILSENHSDLTYVTHEKPTSISVDDTREQINDTIQVRLYNSYYKIYMVDEAGEMTVQVQNALLKTIEELPIHVVILFLTTNQDVSLLTVLSECVQLKLKPLKDSVVKEYLVQSLGENESEADIYVAFIRGNLGKIIHLAQSEKLGVVYREILHLLKRTKDTDIFGLLDYIHKVKEESLDIRECLGFMRTWCRNTLTYKITKDINLLIFKDEFSAVKSISTTSGYDGLEKILEAIDKVRIRLDTDINTELVMEPMLLTMKENQNVSGL